MTKERDLDAMTSGPGNAASPDVPKDVSARLVPDEREAAIQWLSAAFASDYITAEELDETFVVNLSNWHLREAMNASSAAVGPEVDEFALAGVTAAPSTHVKPPRVKEAPASLECRFLSRICLPCTNPNSANNLVIGEVVGIHIDDAIIHNGLIDTAAYHPLARHGYMDFSAADSVFEMLRPTV